MKTSLNWYWKNEVLNKSEKKIGDYSNTEVKMFRDSSKWFFLDSLKKQSQEETAKKCGFNSYFDMQFNFYYSDYDLITFDFAEAAKNQDNSEFLFWLLSDIYFNAVKFID